MQLAGVYWIHPIRGPMRAHYKKPVEANHRVWRTTLPRRAAPSTAPSTSPDSLPLPACSTPPVGGMCGTAAADSEAVLPHPVPATRGLRGRVARNRENRRRGFHRFIAAADPLRGASAPEQRAPHEAREIHLILECVPARLAEPPDAPEGHDGLPPTEQVPVRSFSDQDRRRFSAGARASRARLRAPFARTASTLRR